MRITEDYGFARDELAFISHFEGLETLSIMDARDTNLDLSLISNMTRLRRLEIHAARLTIDDMRRSRT